MIDSKALTSIAIIEFNVAIPTYTDPSRNGATMLDFPVAPPIFVKDTPQKRKIATLTEARAFVDEMLHQRRLYRLREVKERLDGAKIEEDAIEAMGALRDCSPTRI